MAFKRKRKTTKKKPAKSKRAVSTSRGVSAYAVASARSGKKRNSGFELNSWKKAGLASLLMRAGEGLVFYATRTAIKTKPLSEQEKTLKLVSVAFPAAIAFFAKKIPVDGLFPIAVDRTVNYAVDMSDTLRDFLDFRFLDKSETPKNGAVRVMNGTTSPRTLPQTRAELPQYMNGRVSIDRADVQNRSGAVSVAGYRR